MKNHNRSSSSFLVLFCAFVIGMLSPAWASQEREIDPERLQAQLEETKERLQLTDEQVAQLRPILERSLEKRLQVLEKHGISLDPEAPQKKLGLRKARKLRNDMKKVRKETEEELKGVLSQNQMKEWKKIEEERSQRLREELQKRRG